MLLISAHVVSSVLGKINSNVWKAIAHYQYKVWWNCLKSIFVLCRRNDIIAQSELHEAMSCQKKAHVLSQTPGKAALAPCSFRNVSKSKLSSVPVHKMEVTVEIDSAGRSGVEKHQGLLWYYREEEGGEIKEPLISRTSKLSSFPALWSHEESDYWLYYAQGLSQNFLRNSKQQNPGSLKKKKEEETFFFLFPPKYQRR